MAISPERKVSEEVTFIPETPEIPDYIEKAGVSTTPSQVTAQVADNNGQNMLQTSANQTITITLPASKERLEVLAKGKITDALTWFALFWLRILKKAMHFGWRVIAGAPKQP